ncbi:m84R [Myxoma virus]|uniref:M84R n=1 Tax=Myxoma virus TaxID=10273 RepID=A0A481N2A0_9POXV|nr:m84R [Myxoma virus]QAV34735.1 m84R [Myxoma virus]QAV36763.1 m84R [Myxoma virus]
MTTFETPREVVFIERVDSIPQSKKTHVFAICVTADNKPIVAARRSSFVFQEMIMNMNPPIIVTISKHLTNYMYNNEIKEIKRKLQKGSVYIPRNSFEELILLGGKLNKSETIDECIQREITEETDAKLTIKSIGTACVKITITDKLFNRKYVNYCKLCYIHELMEEALSFVIYNVEIRKLKSLLDCVNNDKFTYLRFIYNTLLYSK